MFFEYLPRLRTLNCFIEPGETYEYDRPADRKTENTLTWRNVNLELKQRHEFTLHSGHHTIRCLNCKDTLIDKHLEVKLLPCENWMELVDCWSCHKDEFAGVAKSSLSPLPESILLGTDHFLVNPEDLSACKCHRNSNRIDLETVVIDGQSPGLESIIYAYLFELIEVHGESRYTFTDQSTSVSLHVLAWDLWAGNSISSLSPAMKIAVYPTEQQNFEHRHESEQRIQVLLDLIHSKKKFKVNLNEQNVYTFYLLK